MGGRVHVKSKKDVGSTFAVELISLSCVETSSDDFNDESLFSFNENDLGSSKKSSKRVFPKFEGMESVDFDL